MAVSSKTDSLQWYVKLFASLHFTDGILSTQQAVCSVKIPHYI